MNLSQLCKKESKLRENISELQHRIYQIQDEERNVIIEQAQLEQAIHNAQEKYDLQMKLLTTQIDQWKQKLTAINHEIDLLDTAIQKSKESGLSTTLELLANEGVYSQMRAIEDALTPVAAMTSALTALSIFPLEASDATVFFSKSFT